MRIAVAVAVVVVPPKFDAARALAEEFKQRAPAYRGMLGYDDMIAGISHVAMPDKNAAAPNAPAPTPNSEGSSPTAP